MKKIISLILAVIMIATLGSVLVTAVAADEAAEPAGEVYLFRNGELCDLEPYPFADALVLAAMDGCNPGTEETAAPTYTLKLITNVNMTTGFTSTDDTNINIVIDGLLPDGTNAKINSTVTGNNFRLEGDGNLVLKNVDITSSPTGGCLIQLHEKGVANLDIIDSNITTTRELYYTVNSMRKDGGKAYINIVRSTMTQLDPQLLTIKNQEVKKDDVVLGTNPLPTYQYIPQRGIIGTCNAGGNDHHLVLNIVDSTLKSQSTCIFVNSGSTADIDVKNSTLEVLAHETAGFKTVWASTSTLKKYYVAGYLDNELNVLAAVTLDPVSKLMTSNTLRDGTYDNITFDAVDSLIKYPQGGQAFGLITAYNELNYSNADPYALTDLDTCPDPSTFTVNADKTTELQAASKVTTNYQVGEPDATVKSDLTGLNLIACPVVQVPTPEETTTGATETTTAEPETTTDDPEGDDTTPPADDQTTAPAGDDVTTAADDAAAGGCAGCNDAGAGAAIALAVAMAAAVAIIVKKK